MGIKALSPEEASKLLELAGNAYRPKEIITLRNEIEAETSRAELAALDTGVINPAHIQNITKMKFRLNDLYIDWTQGKLS